jgi:hypothetical protein
MQTHRLPPRTFASYAWGGYVIWKLYPQYRDFIDGRANTLFDTRILHDYVIAANAAPGWQSVLSRYRVQNVLVERRSPLAAALAGGAGWKLAYRDKTASLFTRDQA